MCSWKETYVVGRKPMRCCDVEGGRKRCMVTFREKIMSFFQASDNKLAMKLYRNHNALMRERLRQREANNWVIHPCSDFRYVPIINL